MRSVAHVDAGAPDLVVHDACNVRGEHPANARREQPAHLGDRQWPEAQQPRLERLAVLPFNHRAHRAAHFEGVEDFKRARMPEVRHERLPALAGFSLGRRVIAWQVPAQRDDPLRHALPRLVHNAVLIGAEHAG